MKMNLDLPRGGVADEVVGRVTEAIWQAVRRHAGAVHRDCCVETGVGRIVRERFVSDPGKPTFDLSLFCLVLAHEVLEPMEDCLTPEAFTALTVAIPEAVEEALAPYVRDGWVPAVRNWRSPPSVTPHA